MTVKPNDGEIYEKHAEELIRFATALVGPSDASDVLSTAVVGALSSSSWGGVGNRRAYLYQSVLNACRSDHRSNQRRKVRERIVAPSGLVESPTPRPEVLDAVKGLSPRQRAVTYLTYWEDLDPSSIAGLLDLSEGTVRRHLARARAHLRRKLND